MIAAPKKPAVVAVSSLVARGGVGLRASAFALQRLGFPVWEIPTIFLPWHTGHGPSTRIVPPAEGFAGVVSELAGSPHLAEVGAVLTGYLGSPAQAEAIAGLVTALKRVNPEALFVCDPVVGDEEGLYVPETTAKAIRDVLLPLADVTTPNRFELAWLAGMPTETPSEAVAAARTLGPARVVVTSAPALMRNSTGVMMVTPTEAMVAEHPYLEDAPSGVGDLAGAIVTAGLLERRPDEKTLAWVAAALFEMVARTLKGGHDELAVVAEQDVVVRPMAHVAMRRLAEPKRPSPKPAETIAAPAVRPAAQRGWVAGVDGCKNGWAVVLRAVGHDAAPRLLKVARFADLLDLEEAPLIVAVDMPIGLPDFVGPDGRGPERAVRPHLGARQSSVFSVPSRGAVIDSGDDYALACARALETSAPPRKIAKQAFGLFPKIREIDAVMSPDLEEKVYEVHPELAFWRLNGEWPMALPKKVRSEASRPGIDERIALLSRHGYDAAFFAARRPSGVGPDDAVDAAVCAVMAERILRGEAQPFPADPPRDARGLRMAIWA